MNVLGTLSWVIIVDTTVDKFIMRREVSIIIRNYFRKTWIRSNNIPILLVYSYLIEILIKSANLKFSEQRSRETEHNIIPTLFCHQVRARSVTNDTIRGSTDSTKTLMLSQVVTATHDSPVHRFWRRNKVRKRQDTWRDDALLETPSVTWNSSFFSLERGDFYSSLEVFFK